VAVSLGLFGAIVAGSETSSNIFFYSIEKTATNNLGLNSEFIIIYGSHAVAGGGASAVTSAKIDNVAATIESRETESSMMRKNLVIALTLTIATDTCTGILVSLGIQSERCRCVHSSSRDFLFFAESLFADWYDWVASDF